MLKNPTSFPKNAFTYFVWISRKIAAEVSYSV